MPRTQKENNILAAIIGIIAIYFGEGVFGWGIYFPFLITLADREWVYYYALGIGILGSLMTGTTIGILSLILVCWLILFVKLVGPFQRNLGVVLLTVTLGNFLTDRLIGAEWGFVETFINVLLTSLVFFSHRGEVDLRLKT